SALKTWGAKLRNGGNVAVGAAKALPYHSAQLFVVPKGKPGTDCRYVGMKVFSDERKRLHECYCKEGDILKIRNRVPGL
ncbi:hypothetical protein RF55_3640, partial [Lasius niger]